MFNFLLTLWVQFVRPKPLLFGQWAKWEEDLASHKELKNSTVYTRVYFDYIRSCMNIPMWLLKRVKWQLVVLLYALCRKINAPSPIPLLQAALKEQEDEWDYRGRKYYVWANLIASQYGWTLDYINSLPVDTVISLVMEIIVEKQAEKEFLWSTSEVAYAYDSTTKKSKYVSLPRPKFMLPKPKPIKKVLMPKMLLPAGVVEDLGGMLDYVEKKIQTQAPQPQ